MDPGTDSQGAPFIAKLDAESGQYNVLQTISPADAGVHDLHVLDSNQILLATNKQGIAPLIYTVDKRSFSAITDGIPSNWSLPFVYSPDGKVVFTMGKYWDGGIPMLSLIRLDSYRLNSGYRNPVVWDGSNHPVWSAGFGQDVVSSPVRSCFIVDRIFSRRSISAIAICRKTTCIVIGCARQGAPLCKESVLSPASGTVSRAGSGHKAA